ncbi:MAG TPA: acetyl-CoA carboxylase biotin carboxyl carrier protein [Gemmatimonadaceae bacterium]|nr:acetyl-CoA carboxylase biotin carboxyl carrier protein [Gemmatimonadaceae bacterium]
MIDLRYVKKLIEMLDESTVDSIEISSDKGLKIRLSKSPVARGAVTMAAPVAMPAVDVARLTPPAGVPAAATAPEAQPPAAVPQSAPAASNLQEVKSPMVGTYYGAPEPGAKPYVTVGDRIKKGQVLCIIEAMKIMNEIESEVDGVVRESLVDNAHPVEYGQVLFRVDSNA